MAFSYSENLTIPSISLWICAVGVVDTPQALPRHIHTSSYIFEVGKTMHHSITTISVIPFSQVLAVHNPKGLRSNHTTTQPLSQKTFKTRESLS